MARRELKLEELEKVSGGYTGAVSFCDEDFYEYRKEGGSTGGWIEGGASGSWETAGASGGW